MALISWDDDEDKKKDDLFGTPVTTIASVQSGWQPAPSGADSAVASDDSTAPKVNGGIFDQPNAPTQIQGNYLLSDQKAKVDEQKRQHDAEVAEARRQDAARQAVEAAAQFKEGQVQNSQGQPIDVEEIKRDTGWKKYYDEIFKKEKDQLDFFGRLMDGGQTSKNAEALARIKYNSELLRQAYDDNGNVLDEGAALKAKQHAAYNSALTEDNSNRSTVLARAIGATKDSEGSGFWNRVKNAINAEKQMNIWDAAFGADDATKTDLNDLGRFGGGLVQGFATMPAIGAKEIKEAVSGSGTSSQTGFEEDLTAGERFGRGISGGLNVVTPFVGGSGKLLDSLTTKVMTNTATAAEKTLLKRLTAQILLPAIEQGGIGATQAGAEYFGNGNSLLDENGDFDKDKLFEFSKQVGEAGALGFGGGVVLSGAGMGVRNLRNRNIPTLDAGELAALETSNTNSGVAQLDSIRAAEAPGESLAALEGTDLTPMAELKPVVADGIATPDIPASDGNVAFETPADVPTPVRTPDLLTRPAEVSPVADGSVRTMPAEVTPVREPVIETSVDATPVNADIEAPVNPADVAPITPAPVADGVVRPQEVVPVRDVPTVPTEQVRALQESRAGKSQADEAVIAQRIQELQDIPRSDRTEAQSAELNDMILGGFDKVRKQLGSDEAFYNDFVVPEADKPTRSADLAAEIIGKVENDGMSIKDAIDDSLIQDVPKTAQENAYDAYDSLSSEIRRLEKSSNQPGLWSQVQKQMAGMPVAERVQFLNDAFKRMRNEGVLAKDFINNQNGNIPENPTPASRTENSVTPVAEKNLVPLKNEKVPEVDNVPEMEVPGDGRLTPVQVAERLMPKLADNKDVKKRIAEAAGMGKDVESPIRDILREGNVKPKQAERIAGQFEKLEEHLQDYNRLEEMNQKAYAEGGTENLDESVSRERSRAARELGITTRRLMSDIKKMEGSRDKKVALINGITDIIGTRNASVLSSAGLLERNIFQELTANAKLAVKNPIKMAKSTFANGNILKDTAKSELSHWRDAPRNPIEAVKYVVGNIYRTGMIPTTALANTRRGAVRDELTRWAFQELEGRKVSSKEAHKLAGTAGNEMEALVNTFIGVDNGMTNRKQATQALKAWKEYIRTGDDGAKAEFLQKVENHNSLADQMIAGLSKEDSTKARGLMAMKNLIFPFVRTATNLAKNTVRQDLNPFAKSLLDEIRVDQRSGGANAINLVKSKLVDYGIMGGAAALASSGVLVYNDGDEIDKPKGWSIKTGDNTYMPVRATSLELPIALAGTAQQMASDIASGDARDWKYYAGMVTNSLPYIDQFNTTTGAVDSLTSGEDGGYAAKSYGVNMTKSFVPFSNNGIQPYVAGKSGNSLNAKTVYDKNLWTWLSNSVKKSYDPDFYNSLKDSRDNAGRVRTVDNQGVISNKTINDASTAEFNDRITDLVDYGRKNGLGKSTEDMFNTYDTGKNNNFKSVQDSITFLDVEDGGKPDNAKKLEKNGKLSGLSQQMRDGFYGETGSDLLMLDGENLYSDVSVPNKDGTKNSKLPLSMQSIKNAIAQVDLPEADRDKMYEVSQANDALYAQLKNKSISYDQYSAQKAKNEEVYTSILSNSENYKKMLGLFDELDQSGFFEADGLGATKSGQTYLWNSLNALLGSKGATPAANYPDDSKGFTPWGNGKPASNKPGDRGNRGIQWSPVGKRQMANVAAGKYTPVNIKVRLGNEVKKDRSQNYTDRSF